MSSSIVARVVPVCLVLGVSMASAQSASRNHDCERAVRQIVAELSSGQGERVLAAGFPARQALLSATDLASDPQALKLELVGIRDIQFPSNTTCSAHVELKGVRADDNTKSFSFADHWTVKMPTVPAVADAAEEDGLVGSHVGLVMLKVHMIMPPGTRDTVLASEQAVQDSMEKSSWNEDAVTLPLQPAAGWYVRLGEQVVMISEDGRFALDVAGNEAGEIEILNPGRANLLYATFPVETLEAKGQEEPEALIVDIAHGGGCGMNQHQGDDLKWCESLPSGLNK